MKRLVKLCGIFMTLALCTCCDETNQGNEGGNENTSPYYEFPISYKVDGFESDANGVSINVSEVEEKSLIFNLVPGSAISSYRVAVYPKAMLWNLLLNEGKVEATQEECESTVIALMSSYSPFSRSDEEFEAKEFDWVNTEYAQGPILPDCEYFIIVLGCYDTAGENPASLSIAKVTTPCKELVGDPQIAIETEIGYSSFVVRYHPNEDCKYFYHWIWTTKEISEYIDLFGEKLMGDFCRCAASNALDTSNEDNLAIKRTFGANSVEKFNTAVAVALDENETPSKVIVRSDFELLEVPEEESFAPKAKIEPGERIGATVAYFDIEMEKNCMSCFYRLYTLEEAADIQASSEEEKAAVAQSLANEGWGVANTNFSFNTETEKLTGDAFRSSEREFQSELQPDTEYVLVYVAKNYFQQLSELCFSKVFKTKSLTKNNPDACEADVNLYFTDISRWGFTYNFEYDYKTTAAYRFQLVYPYDEDAAIIPPHYINDSNDREKWMTFFYDTYVTSPAGFDVPIANIWTPEKSGYDGYSMFGYDSGITYVIAYCAEDINGVVGPVKFAQVTTTEATPGPNPTIEIQDLAYSDEDGILTGRFVANQDTKMIKYFEVTINDGSLYSNCALNDLVNGQRRDYDTYMALWEGQLIELGLSSNAESVAFGVNCDKNSEYPVLVAAIAIGEENGEDVYSPIACKIYHKGEFKDLSDYRTPPTE